MQHDLLTVELTFESLNKYSKRKGIIHTNRDLFLKNQYYRRKTNFIFLYAFLNYNQKDLVRRVI